MKLEGLKSLPSGGCFRMKQLTKALNERGYQTVEMNTGIKIFDRNGYPLVYIDEVDRLVVFERDTWDRDFEILGMIEGNMQQ